MKVRPPASQRSNPAPTSSASSAPLPARPEVIGHRGAPLAAPENTMASFQAAVEQGADRVELDVRRSADGHLVVIHDAELDRTTDGVGRVVEHTLAELRRLDAGSWFGAGFAGQQVPTLGGVLAWARDRVQLDVEVKDPATQPGLAAQLVSSLREAGVAGQAWVTSKDPAFIAELERLAPELQTGVILGPGAALQGGLAGGLIGLLGGALCSVVGSLPGLAGVGLALAGAGLGGALGGRWGRREAVAEALESSPDMLMPHRVLFGSRGLGRLAEASGLAVVPYGVSSPRQWERLQETPGIRGVITDHPGRLAGTEP